MERIMAATEARVHFGELMRQVVEKGQTVIVERDGMPQVVVLSVGEYERLRAAAKPDDWEEALHRAVAVAERIHARRQGKPLPPPEEIIRAVREERDAEHERYLDLH